MRYCFSIYSYDIKTAWYIAAFISSCHIKLCNPPYYLLLSVIYSFDCISVFVITSVFNLYKYDIIIFLCDNIYLTCFIAEIPFKNSVPIIAMVNAESVKSYVLRGLSVSDKRTVLSPKKSERL